MEEHVTEKHLSKDDGKNDGEEFLLADFEFMANFTQESLRLADKRVDVLLALSTAVYGGIIVLSAASSTKLIAVLCLAFFSSLGLAVAGWYTFNDLLMNNLLMCEYARALNRIRKYFADKYPNIKSYVMMPTSHEHPPYNWRSSGEAIIELINSLSIGVICGVLGVLVQCFRTKQFEIGLDSLYVAVPCFVVFGLLFLLVQRLYASHRFKVAEASASSVRANDADLFASHQQLAFVSGQKRASKVLQQEITAAKNV